MIENLTEKHVSVLNAFLQSYLAWVYKQNPHMLDVFTTEEIMNYMFKCISLPWIVTKIVQENEFYVMSLMYEYVNGQKEWSTLFNDSVQIKCNAVAAFSFSKNTKENRKPTEAQLKYFDALNAKKGNAISIKERNSMGRDEFSLCIDYLKRSIYE